MITFKELTNNKYYQNLGQNANIFNKSKNNA